MSESQTRSDAFVVCESCDSIYVAQIESDGTVRPIGVGPDCTCGNGSFRQFNRS